MFIRHRPSRPILQTILAHQHLNSAVFFGCKRIWKKEGSDLYQAERKKGINALSNFIIYYLLFFTYENLSRLLLALHFKLLSHFRVSQSLPAPLLWYTSASAVLLLQYPHL